MDLTLDHPFDASATRIAAMYADREFSQSRALAPGATEAEAVVDGDPSGAFNVMIRRVMPTDGIQPDFKPFIGAFITVRYTEAWEPPGADGARDGTFAVEIVGVPSRASGVLAIVARGDRSTYLLRGTVEANVPILGGLVEQAVTDAIASGAQAEFAAADAWIAANPGD